MRISTALLSLSLFTACASGGPEIDLDQLRREREFRLAQQADAEREFQKGLELPEVRNLGVHGELIVYHAELAGRLGDEVVRVRVTFVNTTDRPLENIALALEVFDPKRKLIHSTTESVELPRGLRFHSGSCYSTYLEVPTQGAHLEEGWQWGLDVLSGGRSLSEG